MNQRMLAANSCGSGGNGADAWVGQRRNWWGNPR